MKRSRARKLRTTSRTSAVGGLTVGLALVAAGLTAPPATGAPATGQACSADDAASVVLWNQVAADSLGTDALLPPPMMAVGMSYVQAAVYNAVAGIDGTYELYKWSATGPTEASVDAAVAAAARGVILAYFPVATDRVETAYADALAAIPDGPEKDAGVRYGERAANHLLNQRADDGWQGPLTWDRPEAPGVWRPTPPGFAPYTAPWLGDMKPFLLRKDDQFRPGPPPALDSEQYTEDFLEVAEVGSLTSATRTAEQTETANFFGGHLSIQLAAAYRDYVTRHCLGVADAARYFAVAFLNYGDANIAAWDAKFEYGRWRPVTAIQLADTDGNPDTMADPSWTPLLVTPPHPDYLSGHTVSIGSSTTALKKLTGTGHIDLNLFSTVTGTTRHYEKGKALRTDGINARVWGGIHTRTADEVGNEVGRKIAKWTSTRYFGEVSP